MSHGKKGRYDFSCLILQGFGNMKMNKPILEKATVVVLFILVLVVFSFAERDSKKLINLYTRKAAQKDPPVKSGNYTAETAPGQTSLQKNSRQ